MGSEDSGGGGSRTLQELSRTQAMNIAAAANESRPAVTSDFKAWSVPGITTFVRCPHELSSHRNNGVLDGILSIGSAARGTRHEGGDDLGNCLSNAVAAAPKGGSRTVRSIT